MIFSENRFTLFRIMLERKCRAGRVELFTGRSALTGLQRAADATG
jgi:hypothetical protein